MSPVSPVSPAEQSSTLTVGSPVGPLRLEVRDARLVAVRFVDDGDVPVPDRTAPGDEQTLEAARGQLEEYFAGRREAFDLPLGAAGTPFQQRVWEQLGLLDHGATSSYGELAGALGLTGHGSRAVGAANGRNPIPVVVPCHRVIGADGRLTGYAGGLARKQWLLAHERGEQPLPLG